MLHNKSGMILGPSDVVQAMGVYAEETMEMHPPVRENSNLDLYVYFATPSNEDPEIRRLFPNYDRGIESAEFLKFWAALNEVEKHYFRTVDLGFKKERS